MKKVILVRGDQVTPTKTATCPFCGHSAYLKRTVPGISGGVQIECVNCAARGPVYGDKESAYLGFKHGENGWRDA